MSKHTPGPWRLEKERFGQIEIVAEGGYPVTAFCTDDRPEENRANARLTCAAPDLLDKLKEILKVDSHRGGGHSDLFYDDPEFRKELEQVVAKAEGRATRPA